MTISIEDVRGGLADAVKNGAGLRCTPYMVSDVNPPCAMVDRRAMDPRLVLDPSKSAYPFRVVVFAGNISGTAAQKAIDKYCATTGAESVKAAIEDGDNWSAQVDYAQVVLIGDSQERTVGANTYLTVEIDVEVVW